jgi:hypothetical protein
MIKDLSKTSNAYKINPYIAGDPIDDPKLFFGREQLIMTILQSLPRNHIAVQGPRRSGKSSLLNELARRLRNLDDPETCFIPVKFNLQGAAESEFFSKLMRALLRTVQERYPDLPLPGLIYQPQTQAYSNSDLEDDLDTILDTLSDITTKEIKIIMLLDEGDTLNQYDHTTRGKIRTIFSENKAVKMVWVGTNILEAARSDLGSPWYNMFLTHPLPALSEEEARQLVVEPARQVGYTYESEAIQRILAYAGGQPYIIQYLCHWAVGMMLAEAQSNITLADVETAIAHLEDELSAQDTGSVVYPRLQAQAEAELRLAEDSTPYRLKPEDEAE